MTQEKWRKYWGRFLKSREEDSRFPQGTEGRLWIDNMCQFCREWLDSPQDVELFARFFSDIWKVVTAKDERIDGLRKIELLGGSGKARYVTGRAYQDFCYNVLKERFRAFQFKTDDYVRDGYSMKPDISIWKDDNPLAVLELKVGHDFQQLRSVAMESYLLRRELGRKMPVLFLTRGKRYFGKSTTRTEYDRLREFVEPFYFPLDQEECGGLREQTDRLISYLESTLSAS